MRINIIDKENHAFPYSNIFEKEIKEEFLSKTLISLENEKGDIYIYIYNISFKKDGNNNIVINIVSLGKNYKKSMSVNIIDSNIINII